MDQEKPGLLLTPEQKDIVAKSEAAIAAAKPVIAEAEKALTTTPVAPAVTVTPQVIQGAVKELKAGYKTSEFWITLIVHALGWVGFLSTNNTVVQVASATTAVIPVLLYGTWRTYLKSLAG
jgi:hypothetical protein